MFAADSFLGLFDEQGRYKNGDGEVGVVFLTNSGAKYPGKFGFKGGILVSAEMNGASPWGYPDESPLDGLKFLLHFQGDKPRAVFIEKGRVVHNFEVQEVQEGASKEEFLANFRVARNLFFHPRAEVDSPTIDTGSISDALTRSAIWLTPKSVEDLMPQIFPNCKRIAKRNSRKPCKRSCPLRTRSPRQASDERAIRQRSHCFHRHPEHSKPLPSYRGRVQEGGEGAAKCAFPALGGELGL